jgi:uncharacterized protein
MRVVADTNVVVSGLLWQGPSRHVLDMARAGGIFLFTSGEMLEELRDVLQRRKFARRLRLAEVSVDELIVGYAALARVVRPMEIEPMVTDDPDDDAVLACAFAAKAHVIVSGDRHLLDLERIPSMRVLTARQLVTELSADDDAGAEGGPQN